MKPTEVTVLDAGMGKTLMMRGVEIPKTIWSANALIVAPDEVRQVHLENIAAGARIITTNSYGVIKNSLAKVNIEHRYAELNQIAGELAQQAVEQSGLPVEIAGSLPPLNGSYRSDRVLAQTVLEPLYREQAKLLAPYVDIFVCETMSTIGEATAAATPALETGKPVLVAFTLHDTLENRLRSGESLQEAINHLQNLDINGLLVNCCLPERISEAMPLLTASGIGLRGGYANAFTCVPEDWLLDAIKIPTDC